MSDQHAHPLDIYMGTLIETTAPPGLLDTDILVRQSTVGSFQLCPARVGYERAGLSLPAVSEAMVFGTLVHELCEIHLLEGSALRLTKPNEFDEMAQRILTEQYQYSIEEVGSTYKKFRRKVIEAYKLWVFQVYEHLLHHEIKGNRRYYAEQDLYSLLGETDTESIYARGTPDLATLYGMRDFKTTNAAFKWNQEKADTEFQATYYLALHNDTFGKDWYLDEFKFIVYDRKKHDWNVLTTKRSPEQMEASFSIAHQYGLQMSAGVYPATPFKEEYGKVKQGWYCSPKWCAAWNVCEFKGIGINDTSQEATREWQ